MRLILPYHSVFISSVLPFLILGVKASTKRKEKHARSEQEEIATGILFLPIILAGACVTPLFIRKPCGCVQTIYEASGRPNNLSTRSWI